MKNTLLLLLLLLIACNPENKKATSDVGKEFYVSPRGDDLGTGSLNQPFRSLPRAMDAVRDWRGSGSSGPVTIFLRDGRHQLSRTLVLGIEDGAPARSLPGPSHLTFAAYPGETPVVSAGLPISGWQLLDPPPPELPLAARGNVWVADIPAGLNHFRTLYDNQGRLNRAQGHGFNPTGNGDKKTLHFPGGALNNWNNLEDVEILVRPYYPWIINMLPLESVDEASGVARTTVSATYSINPLIHWARNPLGLSVWVENVFEALDEPGEWVVNTQTGKVYLWPSDPDNDGSPRGILAPSTSELVRVEGQIDYDGPADNPIRSIAFTGLTFTHGDRRGWTTDEDRLGWGLQHDWEMFDRPTALLRFRGAEDCLVFQCRFEHSGGTGVRLDLHAQHNRIIDSEFRYLGGAGILMAGYGLGTKDVNHGNEILNNHIHDFGEILWHSPGIWAWQSGGNLIAHNYLHHSSYGAIFITGRSQGNARPDNETGRTIRTSELDTAGLEYITTYDHWKQRERFLHARHNVVEYNEISYSVQKLTDGNGVYISGAGMGNIVRYNYLHDNDNFTVTETIRCDDDQHETLIYGNVLKHSDGYAVIASKGVNDIINNFIVLPTGVPVRGYISFENSRITGSVVRHNIIVSNADGGSAYSAENYLEGYGEARLEDTDLDSNLYYHASNPNWVNGHLQTLRGLGLEQASRFADPLFVDYEGGDYRFRSGSPALEIGIEPLDISLMGRRDNYTLELVPDP